MRRLFLAFCGLLLFVALPAQQAKRVYITLDVSGSMSGNKYVLANYTTQMIVTLCDDEDDVTMFIYGENRKLLDEKNPLSIIQCPFGYINEVAKTLS